MRRPSGSVAASWLAAASIALVLALASAPATLADGRDPRCATWEANGAPPGTDMAAVCPTTEVPATADVNLGEEPLLPYIVALLVAAAVLTGAGFVAMRYTGRRSLPDAPTAWWTCAACGSPNQARRGTCFACQAGRSEPTPTHPA